MCPASKKQRGLPGFHRKGEHEVIDPLCGRLYADTLLIFFKKQFCRTVVSFIVNDPAYADLGLASALYSPAMSQDAIRTAIDVLEGGHPESVVVIPTTIVSADNVADYLDPENTVY